MADYLSLTDSELVVRAQSEGEAFSELVRRHRSACMGLAASILRNSADAEDVVQSALFKAYTHLSTFEHRANFRTWLLRIVVNDALMVIRDSRRARFTSIDQALQPESIRVAQLRSGSKTPEESHHTNEIVHSMRLQIRRLPKVFRRILMLEGIEELELIAVANQLGITKAAAKSRLNRARRALRERIAPHLCTEYSASPLSLSRHV